MILKKLRLKNIRSFENLSLDLNQKIILLSGDVGSGKTTILLSIEFALFGLLRGKVSPNEILRHGENEGFVSLEFEINGNDVIITRFLKRTSNNITQPPGRIIINGSEEELVATELKAKVLELLGYPQSLINKSTNLFRFTVYTPQEQVKLILHESEEERKDIIRKIFALDKYKNIQTNIAPYQTYLRSIIDKNLGILENFAQINEQKTIKENELNIVKKDLVNMNEKWKLAKEKKLIEEEKFNKLQKERDSILQHKQKIQLIKQKVESYEKLIQNSQNQIKNYHDNQSKIKIKEIYFNPEEKKELKEKLNSFREKQLKITSKKSEINAKKSHHQKQIDQILKLDNCPTCKQEVTCEHKENIKTENKKSLEKLDENLVKYNQALAKLEHNINIMTDKLDKFDKLEKDFLTQKQNKKDFDFFTERIKQIQENITKENLNLNKLKLELNQLEENPLTNKEVNIEQEQKSFNLILQEERRLEIEVKSLETKEEMIKKSIADIEKQIRSSLELKKKNSNLIKIRNWITDLFLPLMNSIERRVMFKVHSEFNSLFTQWFNILIEDSSISVRLDQNFTPLIEQNGFDTNIDNLSGGEKTSVALAYRLALNKVLNDYFSKIHTKDLLILDEPTDGFSTEQLNKLSELLSQVNAKQIIIVSHEEKLESLADENIRISKNNHSSSIIGI